MKHTVLPKQNIFDIAVQRYGSIDAVFEIIRQNKGVGLDQPLTPNTDILVAQSTDFTDQRIPNYFSKKNITPGTDINNFQSESNWILLTGFWDDNGVWEDYSNWIDNL